MQQEREEERTHLLGLERAHSLSQGGWGWVLGKQTCSAAQGTVTSFIYCLTVVSYSRTSPPHQTGHQPSLCKKALFPKHSVQRMNGLFAPSAIQMFKSKIFIHFILSSFFFFCLLKIVLQVLASFDIKITIMCKTLTMKGLIRIQAGCPI